MVKGLAHLCILSKDLHRSEYFYADILKFRKKFNFLKDDEIVGYYLDSGNGVFIEIFKSEIINLVKKEPIAHFCLEVEDIDKEISNLRNHNITVTAKSLGQDNSWQAWFKDPSGIDIEFHQYTSNSSQINNKDCVL